jgi:hypothetical protein
MLEEKGGGPGLERLGTLAGRAADQVSTTRIPGPIASLGLALQEL